MKHLINEKYGGGRHYVWCSPVFRARAVGAYAIGSGLAPSSDPYEIYCELHRDCKNNDRHSAKIASQKKSLAGAALLWHSKGTVTDDERDEIIAMIDYASFADWQPVVYAIATDRVLARLEKVPVKDRASLADEFIIPDLGPGEFDLIELAI